MTLPPELSRLGDHLQQAADREVRRRRRAWAARTALAATAFAWLSITLAPATLSPALRTSAPAVTIAESPRCTDARLVQRSPCEGPPLLTDAATDRESPTVVAHFGDAAQSGRPRPETGPGGFAALY